MRYSSQIKPISYEQTQALLKLIALAEADYREGRMMPLEQAFEEADRDMKALLQWRLLNSQT